IDRVRLVERRFDMPDALELPRMVGAIVPLMSRERLPSPVRGIVHELIALRFRETFWRGDWLARRCSRLEPGFAAVIRTLNNLAKPAAGLRGIQAVRIGR